MAPRKAVAMTSHLNHEVGGMFAMKALVTLWCTIARKTACCKITPREASRAIDAGVILTRSLWLLIPLLFGGVQAGATVPDPWTPLEVHRDEKLLEVGVWGRVYQFPNSPLPASITSQGRSLLAEPIRLVGETDSGRIEWTNAGLIPWEQKPEAATLLGWLSGEGLIVNFTLRAEFDGLIRIDMVLAPSPQPKRKLQRLWLEIPLTKEFAQLFHFWPGRWGSAFNSGAVPQEGMRLGFKPVLWLGCEDGGLSVFAESDRGWLPQDPQAAIAILPETQATLLRLHILDSSPPRLPCTFTLAIQATPVKPWASDFHRWRICHGANYGMEKPLAGSPQSESVLAKAARLGVRTLVFHEHWTPVQNYWRTDREEELRSLIEACHQHGIQLWLYFGYELATLNPEYTAVADQVLSLGTDGGVTGGYYRHPPQRDYIVCLQSFWADRLLEGIIEAIDRYGFDGVYLDGTIEPFACANQRHGCGWRTADGQLKPTYPIFAVRDFMRLLYMALHARGKRINAHQSTYCGTATLGFADSYWDGEQFGEGELAAKTLEQLSLPTFRAEFMGRNFGVPCEFLVYERPPHWTFEKALAFTLLHDVRVRPLGVGPMLERIAPIWEALDQFGVAEAEWFPYWRNQEFLRVAGEFAKVSGYRQKRDQQAQWLLVISNLSEEADSEIQVELLDPAIPASAKALDALTGEAVECSSRVLRAQVPAMRMRLVKVE